MRVCVGGAIILVLLTVGNAAAADPQQSVRVLAGTFRLAPSACPGGRPIGSYLVVSFGPSVARNRSSTCGGGIYTLLSQGTIGLPTDRFLPNPQPTFDRSANSLAADLIRPTAFAGHNLGMATSPEDVQDAPRGPAAFPRPRALVKGGTLLVDLRSLNVTYNGPPGSTCVTAAGVGCWQEGSRAAIGTYDEGSGRFVLDWFSSQSFSGASAGVAFHLEGTFTGDTALAPPGTPFTLPQQYALGNASAPTTTPPSTASGPRRSTSGPKNVLAKGQLPSTDRSSSIVVPSVVAASLVVLVGAAAARLVATGQRSH